MIKDGSVWTSSDRTKFIVIHTVELEGKTWVHYRLHDTKKPALECKEYSCYEESFVSRFTESPE
jgi:hypothetical protein